jgi:hypothetical protein
MPVRLAHANANTDGSVVVEVVLAVARRGIGSQLN